MKKQRKFAGHPAIISAASEDRISDLPDAVLHLILRRMNSPTQAGQTMALSRRWRSLWRSYPVLEFDEADCHSHRGWKNCPATVAVATDYLHKFTAASIERFSGNQLPIEAFKVTLAREDVRIKKRRRSAVILEQLLSLAWERKPGEITMDITGYRLLYRKGILTSGLKILRLTGIKFGSDWRCDDLPPLSSLRLLRLKYVKFNHENLLANLIARAPFLETLEHRGSAAGSTKLQVISKLPTNLNSLRFLCLANVAFENHDQLFTNLISSSPLLETLELREISKLRKLRVISRLNNLKTVKIGYPLDAERIEIDAPGLQTLHLQPLYHEVIEIEVTAPELRHLELGGSGFTERNVCELLSNLGGGSSLKSLTLLGLDRVEKLNFSSPELEECKLFMWANSKLREIQLDAGPRLAKFFVGCRNVLPDGKLEKCEISCDATACRLEVDFGHVRFDSSRLFGGLRRVIAGFSQLHTVSISFLYSPGYSSDWDKLDRSLQPVAILHLKVGIDMVSSRDRITILDGLFWACRPRFLTVVPRTSELKLIFKFLLSLKSQYLSEHCAGEGGDQEGEFEEKQHSLHRLKDVKIVTGDVDRPNEMKEEELVNVSKDVGALLGMQRQVSFKLTWHE